MSFKPGLDINPGEKIEIISNVSVIIGEKKNLKVEQVFSIYSQDKPHSLIKSMRSIVVKKGQFGGSYKTVISFTMPARMPEGKYPIALEIYISGKKVKIKKYTLTVKG